MKTKIFFLLIFLSPFLFSFSNESVSTINQEDELTGEPGDIECTYSINRLSEWDFNVNIEIKSIGANFFSVKTRDRDLGFVFTENYNNLQYLKYTSINLNYGSEIQFQIVSTNQYGSKTVEFSLPIIYCEEDNVLSISAKNIDGEKLDPNSILLIGDICSFEIKDANNEDIELKSIKWDFLAQRNYQTFSPFLLGSAESVYQTKISTENVINLKRDNLETFRRVSFDGDNSVYFQADVSCEIIFKNNEKRVYHFPLLLSIKELMDMETSVKYLNNENPKIYPNPANNFIKIEHDGSIKIESILFFDVAGKLCKKVLSPDNELIEVSELFNGMYTLHLKFKDSNASKCLKMIKL